MRRSPHQAETSARTTLLISLFVCLTSVAIIAQSMWAIEQDRRLTVNAEYEHGLIAVRLLDEHATQTIREGERNLDSVINAIQVAGKDQAISNQLIRAILTKAQPFNSVMKALQFVNPEGEAWVSSIDYPAYQTDADDRTYIPYLLKHQEETKVIIGKPFQRFYDAELVMPIAKNVFDESGKYLGIISTDISVAYFNNVYQRVAKDSAAMVSLFTSDGVIIVRFPLNPEQIGQDLSKSPMIQNLKQRSTEGMFEDSHFLDEEHEINRLYTFRKIAGFSITAVFARDTETILSGWRERSKNRIIFTSLIIALLWSLSYFLWRQIRAVHRSSHHLQQSELAAKASEQKFTQLFEHSPVPLILIDMSEGTLIEANQKMLGMLNLSDNQVRHRKLTELELWVDQAEFELHMKRLGSEKQIENHEIQMKNPYGQIYICQISSRTINVNQRSLAIMSMVDISRLRQIESEIRELNNELEEKVHRRTQSLELTNQELELTLVKLKNMQDEVLRSEKMAALGYLVAGISHELNTPIGNSLMVASTMHDHVNELLSMIKEGQIKRSTLTDTLLQSAKAADILMRNLHRAAQLIHSFKQVAVDQSSDQYRIFDLKITIEEILLTIEPMYRRTQHEVIINIPEAIEMHAYPGALGQIITNTISNAVTHAFDGIEHGIITIVANLEPNRRVKLQIRDNGHGIAEEHLPRVFDPFFTTKLGHGGSGLGLNIVYNLATEVLGGSINIESAVDQGTTVVIELPLVAKGPQ
ncbi:ATP-binding protein [Undibacterium cyanobacteriorum]|uniref:histidine kinase n=1 Tax=Undibacterium cyanobacteriorum TaxID=3073561 RepID=A0ABY9RKJ6_9BURK|nr:ATP-binding protein [Undibacterium sp. 20NA77.5]WMW81364.1 ATP-binding protein [Undibacterium sp. 20NA77.5]